MPFALFGIDNSGVGIVANLLVIFLIALWLALAYWAMNDARRRMQDPVLIGSAALAALIFPLAGALVYAIVRPPETLDEEYERELDVRAAELRLRLLEQALKGGPGSSSFAATVAGELAGDPAARRGSGSSQPPSQPRRPQASTEAQRTSKSPQRESSAPTRPSQSARSASGGGSAQRPAAGNPARPPATGADRP